MINKLRDWGCDVEEALERFVNDQELYCTCFSMFLADDSFNALKQSVECGNCKASFEACHTLKGVAGNLGAGPLYAEICVLTEKFRSGNLDDAMHHVENIFKYRDEALNLIAG